MLIASNKHASPLHFQREHALAEVASIPVGDRLATYEGRCTTKKQLVYAFFVEYQIIMIIWRPLV
jgi:hypothetical protein